MLKRSLLIAAAALLTAALLAVFPVSADTADVPAPTYDDPVISVFPGYVHKVEENGYIFYERNAAAARDVLRYSADLIEFNDYQLQTADVNFDGVIDASDARKLLRYSANIDSFSIKLQKGQTLTFAPDVGWWTLQAVTESSDDLKIEYLREEFVARYPGDYGRQFLYVTPERDGVYTFEAEVRGFTNAVEQNARFKILCDGSTDKSITISCVNYTDDERIYKNSLNADVAGYGTGHMPVYAFDTEEQFSAFKTTCAGYTGLTLNDPWDEGMFSFLKQTAGYDADFFSDNSLILVYVPANSGSKRYSVEYLHIEDGSFCMTVGCETPEVWTCDMSGWFITLEMPDADFAAITSFDAVPYNPD